MSKNDRITSLFTTLIDLVCSVSVGRLTLSIFSSSCMTKGHILIFLENKFPKASNRDRIKVTKNIILTMYFRLLQLRDNSSSHGNVVSLLIFSHVEPFFSICILLYISKKVGSFGMLSQSIIGKQNRSRDILFCSKSVKRVGLIRPNAARTGPFNEIG